MVLLLVLVVTSFPRGCTNSRDCDLCSEVEFVTYFRQLRCMVQDADKVPAAFDHDRLFFLSTKPIELGVVPQERYKALFVQYFRFDVLDQQRVFYREIQLFMAMFCEDLVAEYHSDFEGRLNLSAFAPEAIYRPSKDRVMDSLMDCCLLLTRLGFFSDVQGAKVVQQYDEVYNYFLHRWRSQSSTGPMVYDVINLWRSYPLLVALCGFTGCFQNCHLFFCSKSVCN